MIAQLRHARISLPLAIGLSLVVASQAFALSWATPVALTSSGNAYFSSGLVGIGSDRFVAVFNDGDTITVRRSTDSGVSWKAAKSLASGREGAISGRASAVDVVWLQSGRVRYARSADSAKTFSSAMALSASGFVAESPMVARGPDGLVAVTWLAAATAPCCDGPWTIKTRVSTDGGASFATANSLGTGWEPTVAVGDDVVYVAWNGFDDQRGQPHVRRSLTAGATWSTAAKLPRVSEGLAEIHPSIAAAGADAYVAYNVWQEPADPDAIGDSWIKYVATANRGTTWSTGHDLTAPGFQTSAPVLSLKGDVLRAVYNKSDPPSSPPGIRYKQSGDGTTWSTPVTVASFGQPHGLAVAGRIGVLYTAGELFTDVWVRTATP